MTRKCPICESDAHASLQNYRSSQVSKKTGYLIVVENVEIYNCSNSDCAHTWLPIDQENRIDQIVAAEKL